MIVARQPGKLPGEIFQENYELEYGSNSLLIEKEALEKYTKGDKITCVIFGIDSDRERISLKLSE